MPRVYGGIKSLALVQASKCASTAAMLARLAPKFHWHRCDGNPPPFVLPLFPKITQRLSTRMHTIQLRYKRR